MGADGDAIIATIDYTIWQGWHSTVLLLFMMSMCPPNMVHVCTDTFLLGTAELRTQMTLHPDFII